MSTVLWGARNGDVQYASRDFWRRTIPFGATTLQTAIRPCTLFDVGLRIKVVGAVEREGVILGFEGDRMGVRWL